MKTDQKVRKLKNLIREHQKVIVLFSGGLDSSFLLRLCKDVLGQNVIAITNSNSLIFPEQVTFSQKFAEIINVKHYIIKTNVLKNRFIKFNTKDRCFYCKKIFLEKLSNIKLKLNYNEVFDGTIKEDFKKFRPGLKVNELFNVKSPLAEVNLTKKEIMALSQNMGIESFPSITCVATRIPYFENINSNRIKRIKDGENYLRLIGFRNVRLREHGKIARIEIEKKDLNLLLKNEIKIVKYLKNKGYSYITFDLEYLRSGSMDLWIKKK